VYNFSVFRITKYIYFCYGHRLLNYSGKCRNFHGHNGKVEVEIASSSLNPEGMVRDFGEIKYALQTWIDETLDHRMLLNEKDPLCPMLEKAGEPFYLFQGNPTAENIARLIYETARKKGLPVASVTLWETPNSFAKYSEK
jgi:6-pyruvoyltetrahydropterin/6-carboxytetrahydropterin synthase